MFKKKESKLANRFFAGNVTIKETLQSVEGNTQYILKSGDMEFSMLVFRDKILPHSWKGGLTKNGNNIPLDDTDYKIFCKKMYEYLRQ